jgi:DNA topoisomerase-3
LYEKKLITYPRTDSQHLTPDQVPELPGIARAVGEIPQYREHADVVVQRFAAGWRPDRRVVDPAEVGDHHAILPTDRSPASLGLHVEEKRVYDLVVRRFLAALSPDALFDRTTLVVAVGGIDVPELEDPARFRARGRMTIQEGWRLVDPPGPSKDVDLPAVQQGQSANLPSAEVVEGTTRAPRPHDDASLLYAMETAGKELDDAELRRILRGAGLGTPATRASILETLLIRRFVERQGKELRATDLGISLINGLPVPELASAELTGHWERRLLEVAEGRESRTAFMEAVAGHVSAIVGRFRSAHLPSNPAFADDRDGGKPVGPCPRCQAAVVERGPVYGCSACDFVIFKSIAGREVSRRAATTLLTRGQTEAMKGFKSKKTGKAFSAGLKIGAEGKVELFFPEGEALGPCPTCRKGRVVDRGKVWACDQEGCAAVIFKEVSRRPIQPEEARILLVEGRLPPTDGFLSREDKPFRAGLVFAEGRVRLDFGDGRPASFPTSSTTTPAPTTPATVVPTSPPVAHEELAGQPCPACGTGRLMRGRSGWGCSRWREGCTYVVRAPTEQDQTR